MKHKIIYLTLICWWLLGTSDSMAKVRIIPPAKGQFNTAFVIVIDEASLEAAKPEVMAYKGVLEAEGLAVYIVSDSWKSPEAVKEEMIKLNKKQPTIEGVVFVGQIPIVRVRNAQHMTTAFKMDETAFPMTESSVTSDRFYDDLHLRFERIEQDKENPLIYYYKLREDSPQDIRLTFYSARMLPPSDQGQDAHALLRAYLQKVVAAHREANALDCFVVFAGHGYNSDCLTAWGDEQLAMREYFPAAFGSSKNNAFFNFRQKPYFRNQIYAQLARPEVDLFIFHEHGAFDTQYINGGYPATALNDFMEQSGISFRNGYRRRKGEKAEAFKQEALSEYHLPEKWFQPSVLDSLHHRDSLAKAEIDIVLQDLAGISPNPRFSIFDACYNGSFHQKGYVAGYHVFGNGKTIVAQGNTVNVLQDKWSTELVGLLPRGVRVGFWQKEVIMLESHLIGDPTYRFVPSAQAQQQEMLRLNNDLALHCGDASVWEQYLSLNDPSLQAIALRKLAQLRPAGFAKRLYELYCSTPYHTLRTECIKVAATYPDCNESAYEQDFRYRSQILVRALNDSYELARRLAARYAGMVGDPLLIAPLVDATLQQTEAQRVAYQAQSSLNVFDQDAVTAEYLKQVDRSSFINGSELHGQIEKGQAAIAKRQTNAFQNICNKTADPQLRIRDIRSLRNYNQHSQVTELLKLLGDPEEDTLVRTTLAEALGWFDLSITKPEIIAAIKEILDQEKLPAELQAELIQSSQRLSRSFFDFHK